MDGQQTPTARLASQAVGFAQVRGHHLWQRPEVHPSLVWGPGPGYGAEDCSTQGCPGEPRSAPGPAASRPPPMSAAMTGSGGSLYGPPQVFYNNKGYHSMPTYLNSLNNAILRANLPKSKGNPAAYGG